MQCKLMLQLICPYLNVSTVSIRKKSQSSILFSEICLSRVEKLEYRLISAVMD